MCSQIVKIKIFWILIGFVFISVPNREVIPTALCSRQLKLCVQACGKFGTNGSQFLRWSPVSTSVSLFYL